MDKFPYKRVLITGGAGFIGANLIRILRKLQAKVIVIDNLSTGRRTYLQGIDVEFHDADIQRLQQILPCFDNVDAVIHLAAYGNVIESLREPLKNFHVNAQGTLNVLEAARLSRVRKFLFASTGGALMGKTPPPVDEQSVPRPISPYGASKLAGEGYCSAYSEAYGLSAVCCRFGNVYGEYSAHKKGVITRFIKNISQDKPLTIYGDGTSARDYIYVDDLCDGIIRALNNESKGFDIFHLATGTGTTIGDLADSLYALFPNAKRAITFKPERVGEVIRNFASYDKADKVLDFKPQVSLREGLEKTVRWYKEHVLK